jgi:oxygen-independent coproporphyrinogen-3 oxidase
MNITSLAGAGQLPATLASRLDMQGPRYTSYPTADRFSEDFAESDYRLALQQRAQAAHLGVAAPLSLYVHIPFCESVCYYCACNKVVTRQHGRAVAYLEALEREIALHQEILGPAQAVTQLHFGGGTPTFLCDEELQGLMDTLRRSFRLLPEAELSIEVDPRTVDRARLERLAALGFNRLSLGVQDFDPAVQAAVHRIQPHALVAQLMQSAREIGFASINIDLIYGLPRQTPASFARTLEQVAELRPDRIALYAYAHLPQRFPPQRRIVPAELPAAEDRLQMIQQAIGAFLSQGYTYIGMDHFALADDALARAKQQGQLHRNFQGYSTQADCDLIGLGVSAIGRVGACYSQNAKSLDAYDAALRQRHLPVARGLALTPDDLLRRELIMALMCQGEVCFASIEAHHAIEFRDYFRRELERLQPLQDLGLVHVRPDAVVVSATGWFFVRAIAMVFDRHLQSDHHRERFSRIF